MKRFAVVRGARSEREVRAYLPVAYSVVRVVEEVPAGRLAVVIEGVDEAGWTLDGYVIPRLASGLMFAEEVSADHELARDLFGG